MKKILIIHNQYKEIGGEDIAVKREIELLKNYYNIEELIFDNKKTGILKTIFIFFKNSNHSANIQLSKKIEDFRPDLVYVHNTWFTVSLGIFKILFTNNLPTYIKVHNFRYFCTKFHSSKKHFLDKDFCKACGNSRQKFGIYNKYYDSILKSIFINKYGKKYFQVLSDPRINLIVLTEFHKNFLKNQGINNENIFVIPNYLDTKEEIKENEKENSLVYAGRISKEKGIEGLVEAFQRCNLSSTKLFIVGDGPDFLKFKKKYENEKIVFTGELDNQKTLQYILNSKAVVTNTLMFEGQPTLLCEASMLGKVSVFPNNGGISEFFNDKYSFIFNQNDKKDLIKKLNLLNDNDLIEKESEEINKHIQKLLNKELLLDKFKEVFI